MTHDGTDHAGHTAFGCEMCIAKAKEEIVPEEQQKVNAELENIKTAAEAEETSLRKALDGLRDAVSSIENVVEEMRFSDVTEDLEEALAEMTKRRDEALAVNAEAWQKVTELEKRVREFETERDTLETRAREAEAQRDELLAMLEGGAS